MAHESFVSHFERLPFLQCRLVIHRRRGLVYLSNVQHRIAEGGGCINEERVDRTNRT